MIYTISHLNPGYIISRNPDFNYYDINVVITKPEFDYVQQVTGYWSIQHDGRPKEYYVYAGYGRFLGKKSLEELDNYFVKTSYDSDTIYIFDYSKFLEEIEEIN